MQKNEWKKWLVCHKISPAWIKVPQDTWLTVDRFHTPEPEEMQSRYGENRLPVKTIRILLSTKIYIPYIHSFSDSLVQFKVHCVSWSLEGEAHLSTDQCMKLIRKQKLLRRDKDWCYENLLKICFTDKPTLARSVLDFHWKSNPGTSRVWTKLRFVGAPHGRRFCNGQGGRDCVENKALSPWQ